MNLGGWGRVLCCLRGRGAAGGIILMYHRVTELDSDPWGLCVSPAHFAEHLEVLRQRALPLRLTRLADDLRQGRVSRGAVAITFDDGYGDNLAHAFPLLRRANLPATLFVTTGILTDRREFWWDELEQILLGSNRLPPSLRLTVGGNAHEWELGSEGDCRAEEMLRHRRWRTWEPAPTLRHRAYVAQWETLFELPAKEKRRALDELCAQAEITPGQRSTHRTVSAAEIADLAQHKLVEIGAHSVTHTALSRLSAAGQRREIQGSKKHLEDILGCRVTSFSYPHGNYDENTLSIVRQAGFTCACTTAHATARPGADPFRLPRIQVLDWDGDEFARQLEACQATPHPAGT